jgi:hypothetical protein
MAYGPKLPDAGIPIYGTGPHSMREVLGALAKHAGRSIDVHGAVGAIAGPGGVNLSGPENIPLCLYQIAGIGLSSSSGISSSSGSGDSGDSSGSSSGIAAPPAGSAWAIGGLDPTSWPNGVYWTYGQRAWWWIDQDQPNAPADEGQELIFAPTYVAGPPSLNVGDLVWCYFDEELGAWCILGGSSGVIRARLTSDLYNCGTASFVFLDPPSGSGASSGSCQCNGVDGDSGAVIDDAGLVNEYNELTVFDAAGDAYLPGNENPPILLLVCPSETAGLWRLVNYGIGECVQAGSGSEGSEGSGSSGSGSEGSAGSGSSAPPCVPLSSIPFLRSIPQASSTDVLSGVIGLDANGCLKIFTPNCGSSGGS